MDKTWTTCLSALPAAAGNVEIRAFFPPHPDGVVLAGLAAPDQVEVTLFDPTAGYMAGAEHRAPDNFESPGRIVGKEKFHAGHNLVSVGVI